MRPVEEQFPISFEYNMLYPEELQKAYNLKIHKGVDIATPEGTPIYAPVDGIMNYCGESIGFGLNIKIKFWANWWNRYFGGECFRFTLAHLSKIYYKPAGKKIRKGELLGLTGN